MEAAIQALEPKIRQILSAPGIDLATISAKRVRKQLLELDHSLTSDFIKENKDSIDEVIARVYEEISAALQEELDDDEVGAKRKRDDASDVDVPATSAPKKAKKTKTKQELEDEELARQLQSEYNRGARSSRAAASSKSNGAKRGGRKSKKSSEIVDSDGEADGSDDEKPKKKRGGGGFKKQYALRYVLLSPPLVAWSCSMDVIANLLPRSSKRKSLRVHK